jgi:hypothetical protein
MCNTYYPCSIFYSHFIEEEGINYVSTMFSFLVIGYILCIYQWIQFDKRQKHYELFLKDNIVYARSLMNGWDWRLNKFKDASNRRI